MAYCTECGVKLVYDDASPIRIEDGKVKPVVKERIEDLFMSVNGSPQDFAFRGIVPKDEKRG